MSLLSTHCLPKGFQILPKSSRAKLAFRVFYHVCHQAPDDCHIKVCETDADNDDCLVNLINI